MVGLRQDGDHLGGWSGDVAGREGVVPVAAGSVTVRGGSGDVAGREGAVPVAGRSVSVRCGGGVGVGGGCGCRSGERPVVGSGFRVQGRRHGLGLGTLAVRGR